MPDSRETEARRMNAARLLIRNGRTWLLLTEEDIERGARAVERDPTYRNEIANSARRHAQEINAPLLLVDIVKAQELLND